MNKKIIIFVTAMVIVFAMVTGATFAYLFSNATEITNTFKPSKLGTPTVYEEKGPNFNVVPGVNITKDPKVYYTLSTGNNYQVPAFLYLEVKPGSGWTMSNSGKTYKHAIDSVSDALSFNLVTDNWSYLGKSNGAYIYVYVVKNSSGTAVEQPLSTAIAKANAIQVIANNTITVSTAITKTQMEKITSLGNLAFNAHAIQTASFDDATDAWTTVKGALAK